MENRLVVIILLFVHLMPASHWKNNKTKKIKKDEQFVKSQQTPTFTKNILDCHQNCSCAL